MQLNLFAACDARRQARGCHSTLFGWGGERASAYRVLRVDRIKHALSQPASI